MIVLVQLVFTIGLALFLSALTVHFRDLKDLLGNLVQFWFFATPIIYPMQLAPADMRVAPQPEPDDAPLISYQEVLFFVGPARPLEVAGAASAVLSVVRVPGRVLRVRSAARQLRGRSMTPAIDVINVSKVYRRYARKKQFATLKSALLDGSLLGDLKPDETFQALRGVSFSVPKGCTYGVIGRNGSGKSTLLKCVAGITRPTEGSVKVDGRISALIELGAGFHPEISGRENIFINGIMLGLTKKEIQRRFDEIVEFAEMQDFIDAPVKTYSSGMYMRLGFAVAVHVDPEVLLVDEVLAVGDQGFTHKCLDKFAEFRRRNKSILLVTHSLDLVEKFCDERALARQGRRPRAKAIRSASSPPTSSTSRTREENELAKAEAARVAASAKEVTEAQDDRRLRRTEPPSESGEGPVSSKNPRPEGRVQVRRRPLGHARDRDHQRHARRARRRGRPRVSERRRRSRCAWT